MIKYQQTHLQVPSNKLSAHYSTADSYHLSTRNQTQSQRSSSDQDSSKSIPTQESNPSSDQDLAADCIKFDDALPLKESPSEIMQGRWLEQLQ